MTVEELHLTAANLPSVVNRPGWYEWGGYATEKPLRVLIERINVQFAKGAQINAPALALDLSGGDLDTQGMPLCVGLGDLLTHGGSIYTGGGSLVADLIGTGGGDIHTSGGTIRCSRLDTGGGKIETGGGNLSAESDDLGGIVTQGGFIRTNGGDITTGQDGIQTGGGDIDTRPFDHGGNKRRGNLNIWGGSIESSGGAIHAGAITTHGGYIITGGGQLHASGTIETVGGQIYNSIPERVQPAVTSAVRVALDGDLEGIVKRFSASPDHSRERTFGGGARLIHTALLQVLQDHQVRMESRAAAAWILITLGWSVDQAWAGLCGLPDSYDFLVDQEFINEDDIGGDHPLLVRDMPTLSIQTLMDMFNWVGGAFAECVLRGIQNHCNGEVAEPEVLGRWLIEYVTHSPIGQEAAIALGLLASDLEPYGELRRQAIDVLVEHFVEDTEYIWFANDNHPLDNYPEAIPQLRQVIEVEADSDGKLSANHDDKSISIAAGILGRMGPEAAGCAEQLQMLLDIGCGNEHILREALARIIPPDRG